MRYKLKVWKTIIGFLGSLTLRALEADISSQLLLFNEVFASLKQIKNKVNK